MKKRRRTDLWTAELVVQAGDRCAVVLVGAVDAVLVPVATPSSGNTQRVLAPELASMAWREV